ncbi:hypothetical protein C0J52_08130 [Blattella germanica]|nr:hypothetical protein C0J52_08130 [Blattella germanica]
MIEVGLWSRRDPREALFLAAETLKLAGNTAQDNKTTKIIPRHLQLVIRNDEELNKLLSGERIAQGGVLPNIQAVLLPKKTEKKAKIAVLKKEKEGKNDPLLGEAIAPKKGGKMILCLERPLPQVALPVDSETRQTIVKMQWQENPTFLAQFLAAEILKFAGNAAQDNKTTRIIPKHFQPAIRNDEVLNKLLSGVTIAQGGVLPNIQAVLLPRRYLFKECIVKDKEENLN